MLFDSITEKQVDQFIDDAQTFFAIMAGICAIALVAIHTYRWWVQ